MDSKTLITGVVLAGGLGRRMGGVDKGLKIFRGRPLLDWTLERFAPQVSELLINANQNLPAYAAYGHRVIPDQLGGFAGPLAGLQRALSEASHESVVTVPCDSPFLPTDLVQRLAREVAAQDAQVGVAATGDQSHPVFLYCRRDLLPNLDRYLEAGGRKIDAWYAKLRVVTVSFDDQIEAFRNINTLEELRDLER